MPDSVTNGLIDEASKSMQASDAVMREDIHALKARVTSIDSGLALVHTDLAGMADRMDRIDSRLQRVEHRLNFGGQAQ